MREAELTKSILRPLQARVRRNPPYRGKGWEPELVAVLAREAAAGATYLPLLQLVLEELWRGGELTLAAYHRLGGTLASAIADRAGAVLEYLDFDRTEPTKRRPEGERSAIMRLLLDLVEVPVEPGGRPDVRRSRTRSDLLGKLMVDGERARLLDDLVRARLVGIDRRHGVDHVEIIHGV